MTALLIATRNAHKAREIQRILAADYQCLTLQDFPGAPATVEDGATFAANAAKKVSALADWLAAKPQSWVAGRALLARRPRHPHPAPSTSTPSTPSTIPPPRQAGREVPSPRLFYLMADDSGLEVDALGGAPGVHSARFAALDGAGADNSPDRANNAKLLRLLEGVPAARRTARFRCVLAVRRWFPPSAAGNVLFEGVCAGRIGLQPAGGGGFGYDPLFIPEGCSQSFAELGDAVKNSRSHRALALQKLRDYLANHRGNP
ncbi:MAG: non-canonical purine NTP pyrophosphatase [Verrucomicrobiota bacterium]|jgi:XTP/dITP diphosphohydrolase